MNLDERLSSIRRAVLVNQLHGQTQLASRARERVKGNCSSIGVKSGRGSSIVFCNNPFGLFNQLKMATVAIQQPPLRQSRTPPPHAPSLSLDTSKFKSAPIPNKHLPYCSPGPVPNSPQRTPATPPASPPSKHSSFQTFSLLYPANTHPRVRDFPPVYSITASTLAASLDCLATQPFPDPKQVFPWLHGLHPNNQVQLAFFTARRKALRNTPRCFRGITIVKVGDLTKSKLKGTVDVNELLSPPVGENSTFLEIDPKDGFSVRNFHIQAAKMGRVSDVVLYGDEESTQSEIHSVARRIATAQRAWLEQSSPKERDGPMFNTFVVSSEYIWS